MTRKGHGWSVTRRRRVGVAVQGPVATYRPNTIPQLIRVAWPGRVPLLAAYLPQNDNPPGPKTEGVARIKNRYAVRIDQKLI